MLYNDRMLKQCLLNCVHIESEKGGVDDEEMGGMPLFLLLYSSIQSHTVCVGKVRFSLLLFGSSVF